MMAECQEQLQTRLDLSQIISTAKVDRSLGELLPDRYELQIM
jgi:hypothetical protein